MSFVRSALVAAVLSSTTVAASAGEVYAGIGLPGAMIGYAQPLSSSITVRADLSTLGTHKERRTEDGVPYEARIEAHRAGLFGDWFVAGGFRLTGGLTFNKIGARLDARGDGVTAWDIGGTTIVASPDDRLQVKVEYPKTTPYVGIGYGHHAQAAGWGFVFDIGASIGKPKVTETHSGPNMAMVPQSDIDAEMAEVRDEVGKVKVIPQLSVGVNYRF
jgi:hypothetical protein